MIIKNMDDIVFDMWEADRENGIVYFIFNDKDHEYFITFENIFIDPKDELYEYSENEGIGYIEDIYKDGRIVEDEDEINKILKVLVDKYDAEIENLSESR